MTNVTVTWIDDRRKPTQPPDPKHPNGVVIDMRPTILHNGCPVDLPYPAKRCGKYVVVCNSCGLRTILTTAGRVDDPKRVILACKGN